MELGRLQVVATEGRRRTRTARTRLTDAERELAAYLRAVSAADVGAEAFAEGARGRREAVDEARDHLQRELALRPALPDYGAGRETWDGLNGHERNALLRALLEVVIVRRAGGRGARATLEDRVRVIAHGAGLALPRRRGEIAGGLRPLVFEDLDDEYVLRVPGGEDAF
jgi:hypothetical protein